MDNIIEKEIERWLDWFETDVVPAVKYFRKCSKCKVQQELLSKVFS